ncbi:MAG: GH116 family glycosyl hydrolase, partial [bacterium]
VDENLFNGEYYHQLIDLQDKSIIEKYGAENYWNEEAEEIKYQIAEGCGIDQVLAQWHANLCGLGEIFNAEQTKKALKSIYKYNYKKKMRDFFNPCRLYSLNDEAGLVICDWPEGKPKPVVPITYAEETMNGFEYQAAIHMIQVGLISEGLG